jgi:crotonobetainyl-CoA:carnitine CoA-transferase CaiB-like acyl-CoA transferase
MDKDRTRHARRRGPQHVDTSLYDVVAQGMGRALVGFAEGTARSLADFADAVSSAVVDCAEMCRRLTDDSD